MKVTAYYNHIIPLNFKMKWKILSHGKNNLHYSEFLSSVREAQPEFKSHSPLANVVHVGLLPVARNIKNDALPAFFKRLQCHCIFLQEEHGEVVKSILEPDSLAQIQSFHFLRFVTLSKLLPHSVPPIFLCKQG